MNPALKTKWVKALRSGRYTQTRGQLSRRRPEGEANCCLGVLARVARCGGDWRDHGCLSVVRDPSGLHEKLGLTDKQEEALIHRNDFDRLAFKEIADYIEANL